MKNTLYSIFIIYLTALCTSLAGIKIKGANGAEVEFAAIFDADPSGLVALQNPDSKAITIPWSKIDLSSLKEAQPEIFRAYEKSVATQKGQPLGLGIAESMLSLNQLQEALRQAVKDPYYWPYVNYSYQTTYVDSSGKATTRVYTNTVTRYPPGYISSNTPFLLLKKLKDVQDDKMKKQYFTSVKNGGFGAYGIDTMIERIDYVLEKIPPEKMFPRKPKDLSIIATAKDFKKTIEAMQSAESLSTDHQADIKAFFSAIGIE